MDPEKYSVIELKRWLECHGVKRTGNKQRLIDNVRSAIQADTKVNPKVDCGKWYEKKKEEMKQNGGRDNRRRRRRS